MNVSSQKLAEAAAIIIATAQKDITGCSVIRAKRTTTGTKKAASTAKILNLLLLLS